MSELQELLAEYRAWLEANVKKYLQEEEGTVKRTAIILYTLVIITPLVLIGCAAVNGGSL